MAGQQDDSAKPAAPRKWIRSVANVGFALLAGAALIEMVTAGSARRLVGLVLLLSLVALVPAGIGRMLQRRQQPQPEPEKPQQQTERQQGIAPGQAPRPPGAPGGPGGPQPTGPRDLRDSAEPTRAPEPPPRKDLPRLSELSDSALGPTPTRYTSRGRPAPYVKRPAADGRLAGLLRAVGTPYPFVVVVGRSKAGKSRTALEAVRSMFGSRDPRVIIPGNGDELAELLRPDSPPPPERQPWVVWLDDITAAELAHLSADVLDRASQRAVLVATMTDFRWNQIVATRGDVTATARAALARATAVPLEFELTAAERAEAEQLYPQERVGASIAETLTGCPQLVEKLRTGRETEPAGYTIVRAAADARRAGLNRPIAESELHGLYPLYLRRVRIDLDPTTALFEAGMAWATEPADSGVALLRPVAQEGSFEVLDHVVALHESADSDLAGPVPDAMWRELIAAVPTDDAFAIGIGACVNDNPDAAEAAFRKVAADHAGQSPQAALSLGLLLREQGDVAGARAAYRQAAESGHTDIVPRAALNLGQLLREQGDIPGAETAYRQAAESGHTDVVPRAALNLGQLLRERGDIPGAETAYQQAVDSNHTDIAPTAALNLGMLLKERGDNVRAQAAYQRAVDSGRTDVVPVAALNLGMLLREHGDNVRARTAYQRAVDSGRTDVVPVAALNLGMLLSDQGDASGAEAAYRRAIDSGDRTIVPTAAFHRGALLAQQGDLAGARAAYQQAIDSGHRDVAPRAANNLGVLLAQQDDVAGAQAACQQALDSGHPDVAPMAAHNLAALLARTSDTAAAQTAYQRAIDSGHVDVAPRAALNLGMLLSEQGDLAGARAAYQRAVDSGHDEVVPTASINLGVLLAQQDDVAGARAAFHRAIDAGYVDITPVKQDNNRMLQAAPGAAATTRPTTTPAAAETT